MNFNVFAQYLISARFGYNFSRQSDSGAGIACFCHSLVTSLPTQPLSRPWNSNEHLSTSKQWNTPIHFNVKRFQKLQSRIINNKISHSLKLTKSRRTYIAQHGIFIIKSSDSQLSINRVFSPLSMHENSHNLSMLVWMGLYLCSSWRKYISNFTTF